MEEAVVTQETIDICDKVKSFVDAKRKDLDSLCDLISSLKELKNKNGNLYLFCYFYYYLLKLLKRRRRI